MTYRGHIKGGAIVLDEPVPLPDGAQVEVAVGLAPENPPSFYDRKACGWTVRPAV